MIKQTLTIWLLLASLCSAPTKVLALGVGGNAVDIGDGPSLRCTPNVMTEAVGIENASRINAALAKIGIIGTASSPTSGINTGTNNGPAAIGDSHGGFWAVAAKLNPITGATNATPIVITSANHGLQTEDYIIIDGITGNTNANGTFIVTRIDANTFSIQYPRESASYGGSGSGTNVPGNGAFGGTDPIWCHRAILRIPPVAGGTFFGVGKQTRGLVQTDSSTHVVNNTTHEGSVIGATTFVNCSDLRVRDKTTVLLYQGQGWTLGPFTIDGSYSRDLSTRSTLFTAGDYAYAGVEVRRPETASTPLNSGRAICNIDFVNSYAGYWAAPCANHGDHMLIIDQSNRLVKYGVLLQNIQSIGWTWLNLYHPNSSFPDGSAIFMARSPSGTLAGQGGGSITVEKGTCLDGGAWFTVEDYGSNNNHHNFPYVKFDNAQGLTPFKLIDFKGNIDENAGARIYLSGKIGINEAAAAQGISPWLNVKGHGSSIELDVAGLPADAAIAFPRKPYPTVDQKIFPTPDIGVDTDFTPDMTDLSGWYECRPDQTTINNTLNSGIADATTVTEWDSLYVTTNELTGPGVASYVKSGIHYRPALKVTGGATFLSKISPTGMGAGAGELEVHAVAAMDRVSTAGTAYTIASVNKGDGNAGWALYFSQGAGQENSTLFFLVSQDGTTFPIACQIDNIEEHKSYLISATYDGATGEARLTANGEVSTDTTTPGNIFNSNANFAVGSLYNSVGGVASLFRGRISAVVVKDGLSTTNGTDGEYEMIRSYFRKQFGAW